MGIACAKQKDNVLVESFEGKNVSYVPSILAAQRCQMVQVRDA